MFLNAKACLRGGLLSSWFLLSSLFLLSFWLSLDPNVWLGLFNVIFVQRSVRRSNGCHIWVLSVRLDIFARRNGLRTWKWLRLKKWGIKRNVLHLGPRLGRAILFLLFWLHSPRTFRQTHLLLILMSPFSSYRWFLKDAHDVHHDWTKKGIEFWLLLFWSGGILDSLNHAGDQRPQRGSLLAVHPSTALIIRIVLWIEGAV